MNTILIQINALGACKFKSPNMKPENASKTHIPQMSLVSIFVLKMLQEE